MHTNYPYCTALKNFCWNNGKFSQVAASYNDQNGASLISCMLSNEQAAKIVDVAGTERTWGILERAWSRPTIALAESIGLIASLIPKCPPWRQSSLLTKIDYGLKKKRMKTHTFCTLDFSNARPWCTACCACYVCSTCLLSGLVLVPKEPLPHKR